MSYFKRLMTSLLIVIVAMTSALGQEEACATFYSASNVDGMLADCFEYDGHQTRNEGCFEAIFNGSLGDNSCQRYESDQLGSATCYPISGGAWVTIDLSHNATIVMKVTHPVTIINISLNQEVKIDSLGTWLEINFSAGENIVMAEELVFGTAIWEWHQIDMCQEVGMGSIVLDTTINGCGIPPLDIPGTMVNEIVIGDGCGKADTVLCVFEITTDCGLVRDSAIIVLIDTVGPTLIGVPADTLLACGDSIPTAVVTATDECGSASVEMHESIIGSVCEGREIVRTWTVIDECGNTTTATQVISIEACSSGDTTYVEEMTCTPSQEGKEEKVLQNRWGCDSLVVITNTVLLRSDTTYVVIEEDCGLVDSISVESKVLQNQVGCDSLVVTTTVVVRDTVAPTISLPWSDTLLPCGADLIWPIPQVTDDCDGAPSLEFEDQFFSDPCEGQKIVRNWTSTDVVGNSRSVEQVIFMEICVVVDTISRQEITCDSSKVGTWEELLWSVEGCDSLLILHETVLAQVDTFYVEIETCNADSVGTTVTSFNGCDSLWITSVILGECATTPEEEVTTPPCQIIWRSGNPVRTPDIKLFVDNGAEQATVRFVIANTVGQTVMADQLGVFAPGESLETSIDVSGLSEGIHFITFSINGEMVTAKRFYLRK